ncbi:MAG: hypothetical protein B7X53_00090 [Hyphomonas sp. 34-62-18]|nr:hypothetical protein [Hyphomonas sp. 34-62-18]OZB19400.1 MAG: hypothetical protein B7X53_00090 [Hyphomonas sp. 34-62-18]
MAAGKRNDPNRNIASLLSDAHLETVRGGMLSAVRAFERMDLRSHLLSQLELINRPGQLDQMRSLAQRFADLDAAQHMNPRWVDSLREMAKAMERDNQALANRFATINAAIDASMPATFRLLEKHTALQAALNSSEWQKQLSQFAEAVGPQLSAFQTAMERLALIDLATLRANSEDSREAAARAAHAQAVEAQNLVEALIEAPSPEEGAQLLTLLLPLLVNLLKNTTVELRSLGLVGLLTVLIALNSLLPDTAIQELSEEQRAGFMEMREQIDVLTAHVVELKGTDEELTQAHLEGLERGELQRTANIRRSPTGDAELILKGMEGMPFAIVERQGRWTLIIVRDPLTDRLLQGWVYGNAVHLTRWPQEAD